MASSTTLNQTHQNAEKAWKVWNHGAPKAASIANARAEWAPYLQAWASYIEDVYPKRGAMKPNPGQERVGWIDDDAFWGTFWHKHKETPALFMKGGPLASYFEGACASGNLGFFETMPRALSGDFVHDMARTRVLMEPRVLAWCCSRRPKVDFHMGQCNVLRSLQWQCMDEQSSGLFSCRSGTPKSGALELLCLSAQANGYCEENALRDLLGHAMVNLVPAGSALDAIAGIEERMAEHLPEGLDLRLVAMCSGHALDGTPASQAIAHLGKSILHGKATPKRLPAPAAGIAAMVTSLEHVGSLPELYQAAIELGLHRPESVAFEVDGSLFGTSP